MNSNEQIYFKKYGIGKQILICIHGFGASHLSFKDLGSELNNHYTLYAIDLIGFGNSKKTKEFNYTIAEQAHRIIQFINKQDFKNYTLLGHSYGGAVLLKILLAEDSINIFTNRIILVSPLAYKEKLPFFIRILTNPLLNYINRKVVPSKFQAKVILKFLFYDNSKITKAKINDYAKYYESQSNTETLTNTAKQLTNYDGQEMSESYRNIKNNVLIVYGKQDKLISEKNILRLSKKLQNSKVHFIEKCGHIPHEEKPKEFNKIISKYD